MQTSFVKMFFFINLSVNNNWEFTLNTHELIIIDKKKNKNNINGYQQSQTRLITHLFFKLYYLTAQRRIIFF